MRARSAQDFRDACESVLAATATQLGDILTELAPRLRPFPPFLNMVSVQAVELQATFHSLPERGCVVVNPEGEIREFNLTTIPGVAGVTDMESIEQFQELDSNVEEYIVYARAAIRLLADELQRRGDC